MGGGKPVGQLERAGAVALGEADHLGSLEALYLRRYASPRPA